MSEWKETSLSKVISLIGGGTPKTSIAEYWNGDIPWLSVSDFNTGLKYVHNSEKSITQLGLENSSSKLLQVGDIIISARGTVGVVAMLGCKMAFNQSCYGVRAVDRQSDNDYIFYLLKYAVNNLQQISHGGVFDTITRDTFKEIDISLPPLPEQKAIAAVLSSLDDKIDLLHRQNKTLEAMAETLFRQRFIEEAQEDWEEKKLGDIMTTIESGSRPKGGIDPNLKHGIPSIGAENINGLGNYNFRSTKYITSEYFEKMKRGIVQDYDILIYKDGAYVGKKSMFAHGFPFNKCTINEHVFILRTQSIYLQLFLYFALEQDELAQLNSNSAQPGLNQTSMKSFEIILPDSDSIEMFAQITKPLIDKIFFNGNQIRTLEKLRDTLLTKLMSGEVLVKI